MTGFLDGFRKKVVSSLWKEPEERKVQEIDDKIALGVLMWAVAEADGGFLPEEKDQIREILETCSRVPAGHLPVVLHVIEQAAEERVDLHAFTSELKENLPYPKRIPILDELFRVAFADKELEPAETETIRKVAALLDISHEDFIEAKLRIGKEAGATRYVPK